VNELQLIVARGLYEQETKANYIFASSIHTYLYYNRVVDINKSPCYGILWSI